MLGERWPQEIVAREKQQERNKYPFQGAQNEPARCLVHDPILPVGRILALSVKAYQLTNKDDGTPARLVCENRYLHVELSSQGGGGVRATLKNHEAAPGVLIAPLCGPERAMLSALREAVGEARALLGAIQEDTGVTWSVEARLTCGSSALSLTWNTFNRRLKPAADITLPLSLPSSAVPFAGGAFCSLDDGKKVVVAADTRVASVTANVETVRIRARAPDSLPPLRTRAVTCAVHFVSTPGTPIAANERFVILRDDAEGKLRIQAAEETPSATTFLQLESGETVEAPLSAYPERAAEYVLRGLGAPPKRVLIRSTDGEALLDAPLSSRERAPASLPTEWERWDELPLAEGLRLLAQGNRTEADALLLAAAHTPGLEHAAWFALGLSAMRAERWLLAAADFEESLLYCGTNPLAWWLKHWSLRRIGEEDEHDLPNAHFLAPLEPCLRFEAFLFGGGEKVLEEFRGDPLPFLEVADLLWWCGQESERQMVLAAGADRTCDGLLLRLRARALRQQGMNMEAATEEQKAASARYTTTPSRVSELMELQSG